MVLRMANPTKHPKTGIYYLRVRNSADLVPVIGKKFLNKSLRTKDPQEARVLFASELQKAQQYWAALRRGPQAIPHRQLVALAGKRYRASMEALETEPGETGGGTMVQSIRGLKYCLHGGVARNFATARNSKPRGCPGTSPGPEWNLSRIYRAEACAARSAR